jgi:hypothetical protein
VRLESATGAECRRVRVWTEWSTPRAPSGYGDCGSGATLSLPCGRLLAGQRSEFGFELEAPCGPLSFTGSVVAIEWAVVARAELSWAFDACARRDFVLELGESEYLDGTGGYRSAPRPRPETYVFGSEPLCRRPSCAQPITEPYPFEFALSAVRRLWGRARLPARPVIRVPDQARLGEPFEVRVGFEGTRAPALGRCEVRVIAQELGPVGALTDVFSADELVHFDIADARLDGDDWVASFRLPRTLPPTFSGRHSDIRYNLQIECAAVGAPAWRTERQLTVRP